MYPLILTCYNRPDHTRKTLNELRKYKPEPMYIFVDKVATPKGSWEWAQNKRVRDIVMTEVDWTHAEYHFAKAHKGLRSSIINAVDYVLERHDAMMLLEDDCLPGPYYFDYMQTVLDKYADNPRIMSINGYTIPLPKVDYEWDVYFDPRIGTWGWGTWKRAWKHYRRDTKAGYVEAKNRGVDLSQSGTDIPGIIFNSIVGRNDAWSPGWVLAVYIESGYCVYPTKSHVHNFGFDRSGTNARSSQSKWNTPMAESAPSRLPDDVVIDDTIARFFRGYYG